MSYEVYAILLAFGLFVGMIVMLEIGHRLADRAERHDPGGAHTGTGPVEGAVFALLGLLVAFSFSGAAARFEARRHLIVEEANDIGTAYLRLDLVPAAAQPALRDLFRRYLDSRLEIYRRVPNRKWTHMIVFAAVTALTVYVILDLEYPRLGLIRIDEFDQVLTDVRASMGN